MAAKEKNLFSGGASSVLFTDRRDFYIEPYVLRERWTQVAPFMTMLANGRTKTGLKDPVFKMFQHTNPWKDQRIKVTAAVTSIHATDETSLTLPAYGATTHIGFGTSLTNAIVGHTFMVHANDTVTGKPSGSRVGIILVTSYTNATTIGVKSLSGAFDVPASGWLVNNGNAFGEGSESPEAWHDEIKTVWNQCQIFRTPVQITETMKKAVLRGEMDEFVRLRNEKERQHKYQKEKAMLYGGSRLGTNLGADAETFASNVDTLTDADGEVVRTTMGIIEILLRYGITSTTSDEQNIFNITEGTYKYSDFVDDTTKIFDYIPSEGVKTAFCGNGFLAYFSKLEGPGGAGFSGKSKWEVKLSDMKTNTLGFNYRLLETPMGIIELVPTPALTKSPYNKSAVIVDPENLFHAVYDTPAYHQNIKQDNKPLIQKDEYYSYEGLGVTQLAAHYLLNIV